MLEIGMSGEQLYKIHNAALMGMAGATGLPFDSLVTWATRRSGIMKRRWKAARVGCGTPAVPPELQLGPSFNALRSGA